jgi:hypothetical protein
VLKAAASFPRWMPGYILEIIYLKPARMFHIQNIQYIGVFGISGEA